jgi:hypothetical protein
MKTLQNYFTFNRVQNTSKRPGKNAIASIISEKNGKSIARSALAALLAGSLLINLYGCGKPTNNPIPPPANATGCAIASDVDEALGLRNFEYDDQGHLTKMTGPNYYYGPFVRTISSTKTVDAYPTETVDGFGNHTYGTINITYSYSGGSGNIYDGDPEFMHQLFTAKPSGQSIKSDSLYQFKYDAKKHVTNILIAASGYPGADGFALFRVELQFTYDDNDNATQAKIVNDYVRKVSVYPSGETRIDYVQTSDELLNITYDDKPSPYTAIAKYWKFIGADLNSYGAYNLDKVRFWANRCAIMSKNNPVKITGKLITVGGSPAADVNATLTYQYNDKNLPTSMAIDGAGKNAFTYNCK